MSLLNKQAEKKTERDILTTENRALEKINTKRREQQNNLRKKHGEQWKKEKELIDNLNDEDLKKYIKKAQKDSVRSGMYSIKLNPYEYAIIKQALNKSNCKSSRELIIKLINKIK